MPQLDIDTADNAPDAEEAFIERVAAKYQAQDDAADRAASGDEGEESSEDERTTTDDTSEDADESDDSEHTDADTSADDDSPDGDEAESDEDSEEAGDADHPEDEEHASEESDDDDGAEDDEADEAGAADEDTEEGDDEDEGDEGDEGDEPSEEFQAAARHLGIPLTLDDIKDPTARRLATQKFSQMDAAFTRAMQDLRSYRQEQVQFRADRKFREENPDLAIVEALQSITDPEQRNALFDKINDRLQKLEDPDNRTAFEIVTKDTRAKAATAIEQELEQGQKLTERATYVESAARRLAAKADLPWEFAESAVERALLRKPPATRDLTDEEIAAAIKDEATNYHRHVRAHRREASKKTIQDRTHNRKPVPGGKAPAKAVSPKPTGQGKRKAINYNNEEERHAAMMGTARRLFKGARDE